MQVRTRRVKTSRPPLGSSVRSWPIPLVALWFGIFLYTGGPLALTDNNFSIEDSIHYQESRNVWMKSEDSPLALAGLFWLKPGVTTIGADVTNQIILPAESAPPRIGRLQVESGRVRFLAERGVQVRSQSARVTTKDLRIDGRDENPDVLSFGNLRFKMIKRGDRMGLRLINLKNPSLLQFRKLEFYPIDASFRVEGKFIEYRPAKRIEVANILGQIETMVCPGVVEFSVQGQLQRLEPVLESPSADKLFIMFKDETNGKGSYEGGRYLYAALPSKGKVVLDFNQAHNPYCAYTPYSTCQIPPVENWLKIPIPSGEKKFKDSGKRKFLEGK